MGLNTHKNQLWLLGNWKMHGDLARLERFDSLLRAHFGPHKADEGTTLGLAVPDMLLYPAKGILAGLPCLLGVQTCADQPQGAQTGETSPQLAADLGASFVVLGHSERRQGQGETSAQVRGKAEAAIAAGLTPVICVGETLAERRAGEAEPVVLAQVADSCPQAGDFLIAYEPIWAIGTGVVAAPADAQAMHVVIRSFLKSSPDSSLDKAQRPILYGGSMKPENAADLLAQPDIDGGLIGGASLEPEDLLAIYAARP